MCVSIVETEAIAGEDPFPFYLEVVSVFAKVMLGVSRQLQGDFRRHCVCFCFRKRKGSIIKTNKYNENDER